MEEKAGWTDKNKRRFQSRGLALSSFLRGKTKNFTVGRLLNLLARHRHGRDHRDSPLMFSPVESMPYIDITPVRPAMTSFAVQIVAEELVKRAEKAVHPNAGLHIHIPSAKCPEKKNIATVDWSTLGSQTHARISALHQRYQGLLRYLLLKVLSRSPPLVDETISDKDKQRPVHIVCYFVSISSLLHILMF